MKPNKTFLTAMALAFISALFFMAGAGAFKIMGRTEANFIGLAFALGSGFFWVVYGMSFRKE